MSSKLDEINNTVNLIQPQIREACRLSLPEGLQDLMSDISREVLRAQPQDPYNFIADYLAALMVARENLSIAARLCDTVCSSACNPELEDELRDIGLDDEDVDKVMTIVENHFEKDEVKETSLMIKIAKNTSFDAMLLPEVQQAVRNAFQRNLINNTDIYVSSSDNDLDEVGCAAKHTLDLYRKTRHTPEEYARAALNVQAAYRAYGVRRADPLKRDTIPKREKMPEKSLRFSNDVHSNEETHASYKTCMPSVSSSSLAGSYLHLPKFVPYSVHEARVPESDEKTEQESSSVLYTNGDGSSSSVLKKISFQDMPQEIIEDHATIADDESEESIEEMIASSADENTDE